MTAHVIRGDTADDGFDLFPVRIIIEVGRRRAGDGDEAILGVVGQGGVVKVRALLDAIDQVSAEISIPIENTFGLTEGRLRNSGIIIHITEMLI